MSRLPSRTDHHTRHRVRTGDGWPIALYEYGEPSDPRPPVLLCHGAFSNRVVYDLGRGFGLAPHLARDGRRVFCVELRGRGRSAPRHPLRRAHAVLARGWTIDDLLGLDLPAAIDFVVRHTGAPQLDYVGHSMGGLLIVAYLARVEDARVRRVVSVGSADFTTLEQVHGDPAVRQVDLQRLLAPLFLTLPIVPVRPFARALARLDAVLPSSRPSPGWNVKNVEPAVLRHYLRHGLVSVSSRKLRVFEGLPAQGSLARYRHPTLWVAGSKDRLIAPATTRRCYEQAGSREKRLLLFSRESGHRADYGHSDLLIGRHAAEEVFPEIERWLA